MGSIFNRGTKSKPNWYAQYKEGGRWKMVATKAPTKTQAAAFLAAAETRIANGQVGVLPQVKVMTFAELAELWLREHSAVNCTSHEDNVFRMRKHLLPAFGKMPVNEIDGAAVKAFVARMSALTRPGATKDAASVPKYSPNTINRVLALLRKVLRDGAREWSKKSGLVAAPHIKLLKVPQVPIECLDQAQAERFLNWTRAHQPNDFPLYAAAIFTGLRMGELYGLRWADVNLETAQAAVHRNYQAAFKKDKKVHYTRLNQQVVELLAEWRKRCPESPEGLVFPREDGGMRIAEKPPKGFVDALEASGCPPITFHGLRHSYVSLVVAAGVDIAVAQRLVGHSTLAMTQRYAHFAPAHMQSAANAVSLKLEEGPALLTVMDGGKK